MALACIDGATCLYESTWKKDRRRSVTNSGGKNGKCEEFLMLETRLYGVPIENSIRLDITGLTREGKYPAVSKSGRDVSAVEGIQCQCS